jgi:hypothetical protein
MGRFKLIAQRQSNESIYIFWHEHFMTSKKYAAHFSSSFMLGSWKGKQPQQMSVPFVLRRSEEETGK